MIFPNEHAFDSIIDREAARNAVPASLVRAVIGQESGFKPDAFRDEPGIGDASRGLMQLLLGTARDMGYSGDEEGVFDPATNIALGTKYLSWLRARWGGSWADTVSAYNGGHRPQLGFGEKVSEAGVRCMGRTVPIGEYCNQAHVNRVLGFWNYFETGERPGVTVAAGFGGVIALVLGAGLLFSRAAGY